nr:MAK10-like protein [Tanacetum cinerariifolium]
SITTWEDLTTRFLAQFFPPGRTAKLRNDILMFQQHHEESLSEAWTRFKDLLQKFPHHGIDLWLQVKKIYDHVNPDFAKPVKEIALPQDVPSTSNHRLIELENQVQRLMEAHLALTQPTQVNKITTSCEICSGPHDTQYCMENPEQAFVECASSRTDEAGAGTLPRDTVKNPKLSTYSVLSARSYPTENPQCSTQTHDSIKSITIYTKQQSTSYDDGEKENKEEEDNLKNIHVNPPTPPNPSTTFITEKVLKFNLFFESLELVSPSSNTELICTKEEDGDMMFIEIVPKDDNSRKEEPKQESKRENANEGFCNFKGRINRMHVFEGNFTYVVDVMIIEDISSIIDPIVVSSARETFCGNIQHDSQPTRRSSPVLQ